MRVTEHKVNECNDQIEIERKPDENGDPCNYELSIGGAPPDLLRFQHGPIKEVGVNGLTNEALLAIVADRLRVFQAGKFSCRENAIALTKIEEAQHWLAHRTRARVARGVEGTHQV